jgi:four helix bundle protein
MMYDLLFMILIYNWRRIRSLWEMNPEELKARTKRFALRVMKMTDALPRTAKGKVVANQILRSATAVASGYRAACRGRSKADWIDKIGRVLEEVDESLLWLELTEEGGLLPARRIGALKTEASQLVAIFTAIHKSSKS